MNVDKLFQEKLKSFEIENSANIEALLVTKLNRAYYWHILKWISGIVFIAGLGIITLLPKPTNDDISVNKSDKRTVVLNTTENETKQNKVEPKEEYIKPLPIKEDKELALVENTFEKGTFAKQETIMEQKAKEPEPLSVKTKETSTIPSRKKDLNPVYPKTNFIEIKSRQIPNLNKQNLNTQVKSQKASNKNRKPKKLKKQKHAKQKGMYLSESLSNLGAYGELYFMPFLFQNTLKADMPSSDTVVSSIVKETPQLSYQITLGFRLQKKNKPWFVQTGLSYQNFKEKVDYSFRREYIDYDLSHWDYDSIFEYHIDPPVFDTVLVRVDSAYVEYWDKTENTKQHINSYTYLSIPILIGYDFYKPGKRFSFQTSLGVMMAISLQNNGYLYNEYGHIINYQSQEIKPLISWSVILNTTFNYKVKKSTLFVRPSLQYQLNKQNIIEQLHQRKYIVYGLSFGIRLKIF